MKGSGVLLPGLGPPVQILAQPPSSASTSRSAFSSQFHTCRPIQQHSSHTTRPRQYVPILDSESRDGILHQRNFPSSFCGDTRLRIQQKPSFPKKISKDMGHVVRKKFLGVQSFDRPFVESQQPRGTFPSSGPRNAPEFEPKFPSSNLDQSKTWHLNSPGGLDQSSSSPALEIVQPGSKVSSKPELAGRNGNSEQRRSRLAEDSISNQRVPRPQLQKRMEPSYVIADQPVSRQSKTSAPTSRTWAPREHLVARVEPEYRITDQRVRSSLESGAHPNSYAAPRSLGKFGSVVEPAYMVYDQARSSQNGAHPAPNNYRSPTSTVKQRYERSVIRQNPSADAFRDQWRFQKMAAELQYKRDAQWADNSSYRREAEVSLRFQGEGGHGSNVAQLEVPPPQARLGANSSYRREAEVSLRLQGERGHGGNVAQLEVPPPQARVGAAKWREAAKIIEQNRNPSHKAGIVEALRQKTDRLTIELEPVVDFANLNRGSASNEVLQIFESEPLYREGEGPASAVIEGGGSENSVAHIVLTEELVKSGSRDNSQQANLSNLPEKEEQWTNAEVLPVNNVATPEKEEQWTNAEVLPVNNVATPEKEEQWTNAEVLLVNNVATAEVIVEKLRGQYKDFIHACDTEVADIDVKKHSPVGHGRMICFSVYCGPKTDFGDGKCRLWVDVLGKPEVLEVFKSYFEDPNIKKVWHNYSFDRHILANHGINAKGFYADTMHLARLYDSARTVVQGGYSLEGLTADRHLMGGHWGELKMEEESAGKRSMKHLFGKPNVKKNGEEGKLRVVPPVEELQTQPEWRDKWIHYSSFDTVCTWCLWSSLQEKLQTKDWKIEGKFMQKGKSMYNFYVEYVQPFGELLVQMEAEGMMLDRDHLAKIEEIAIKQQEFAANQFKKWAAKRCPDAVYMNVGSDAQIRQLLFGGKENKHDPTKRLEMERIFNAPNTENYIEEGRKVPKKTKPFTLCCLGADIPVDTYTSGGWPAVGGDALKVLAGKVSIDYNMLAEEDPVDDVFLDATGEDSTVLTSTGVKGGSEEDLSVYGKAYMAFGGGKEGKEACMALAALCEVSSINTLISNFIQPLQGNDIKGPDGRIHCSLNINTETGRLSARRPSLQNQPALEKDRYKIRQAFVAAPGKSLIVADYGQLELRILAHLTDCKSMLKAFVDGGDFHSRTAMNMYAHVRSAVENGDVILEWEPKPGETKPPVPLLKDVFGAERRKAKMLNFSIAYGKTAMGLSKDWKVSLDEAKSTVELWYSDRQEVLSWQRQRVKEALDTHYVHTLLGRTRRFPDVTSSSRLIRGHIERAAINTPVQGSAADVAMCAMLQINRNKVLQDLGWKLVLQVHDEVILEGPSESAAVAKDLVVKCMGFPFGGKNNLKVALAVDAKFAQSWYAAK